jgi:hypothetical protein
MVFPIMTEEFPVRVTWTAWICEEALLPAEEEPPTEEELPLFEVEAVEALEPEALELAELDCAALEAEALDGRELELFSVVPHPVKTKPAARRATEKTFREYGFFIKPP